MLQSWRLFMLILQAFILWSIVAALMTGGAMLFHRYFPDESPWLAYLVPPLGFVVLLNFVEHLVALPVLLYLLPVVLAGTVWMATSGKWFKPALILPTGVFLGCFAFTFLVRCLQPDIMYTSDGISDLNMINNYLQGQTLPPTDTWMPPFKFEWYYGLQHYAGSIVARLLGVKIGEADNVSHGLLNALVCVAGAAAAHRLSGGRLAVTLALPFLIIGAATGSSAYLILFCHSNDQWIPADLSSGMTLPHPDNNPVWNNPLWQFLRWDPRPDIANLRTAETLRLQVPGFWTWRDEYHANASGHLLTLLSVFVVAELVETKRTVWSWVLAAIMPLLAATASAWALPVCVLLCWGILPVAWIAGRRPTTIHAAMWTLFICVTLIWPAFYNTTSNPETPEITWITPIQRTPLLEFLVQWWPIIILWICALANWRSLSFGVRWFLVVIPAMLIFIESVTIESRYNTVEKMWGYTWAVGLAGLFPVIASRPLIGFRILVLVFLVSGLTSLMNNLYNVFKWEAHPFRLDGTAYIMADDQKKLMLQIVGQTRRVTYLAGKCAYCYNEAPALTVFTNNRAYIAWSWFESHANFIDQANKREQEDNAFYSGAMTDRLNFLVNNSIDGVLIWPDDDISDDALAALKQELGSVYEYRDCKATGSRNAGVFVLKPKA